MARNQVKKRNPRLRFVNTSIACRSRASEMKLGKICDLYYSNYVLPRSRCASRCWHPPTKSRLVSQNKKRNSFQTSVHWGKNFNLMLYIIHNITLLQFYLKRYFYYRERERYTYIRNIKIYKKYLFYFIFIILFL